MKQAIITALNDKFAGVSANILGRVADKLISSGKVKKSGRYYGHGSGRDLLAGSQTPKAPHQPRVVEVLFQ